MIHDHHNHCEHQMAYCAKCDVAYCKKCSREWGKVQTYPYYPYWPYWGTTTTPVYTWDTSTTAPSVATNTLTVTNGHDHS